MRRVLALLLVPPDKNDPFLWSFLIRPLELPSPTPIQRITIICVRGGGRASQPFSAPFSSSIQANIMPTALS